MLTHLDQPPTIDVHRLAERVVAGEQRGDTPFGLYVLGSATDGAELGRIVERDVFGEFFDNSPELLAEEYDPFEAASVFLVVIDHRRQVPAGAMRLILPSPRGFKSLDDITTTWCEPVDEVLARSRVDLDHDATWDVATLAVGADYRGSASAGLVSLAMYHGLAALTVSHDVRWLVAVLDLVVLDLLQNQLHGVFRPFTGLAPKQYLDSASSLPVYADLPDYFARLREVDPGLSELVHEGTGLEAVLSTPDFAPGSTGIHLPAAG